MIAVPAAVAKAFVHGKRLTVRVTDGIVSGSLRNRGITEEIIEQVCDLQLEQRENVIGFFEAERMLATDAMFKRRVSGLKRRTR